MVPTWSPLNSCPPVVAVLRGAIKTQRDRGLDGGRRSLGGHVLGIILTSDKISLLLVLPVMDTTSPVTMPHTFHIKKLSKVSFSSSALV